MQKADSLTSQCSAVVLCTPKCSKAGGFYSNLLPRITDIVLVFSAFENISLLYFIEVSFTKLFLYLNVVAVFKAFDWLLQSEMFDRWYCVRMCVCEIWEISDYVTSRHTSYRCLLSSPLLMLKRKHRKQKVREASKNTRFN